MTTFYFRVEMTKVSGCYWTIGLNLEATDYNEALRIFRAWTFGVEAASSLTPHLRSLGDTPTPDRSYFEVMDSPKAIFKELSASFLDKDSYDPDDDSTPGPDMVDVDPDREIPF